MTGLEQARHKEGSGSMSDFKVWNWTESSPRISNRSREQSWTTRIPDTTLTGRM